MTDYMTYKKWLELNKDKASINMNTIKLCKIIPDKTHTSVRSDLDQIGIGPIREERDKNEQRQFQEYRRNDLHVTNIFMYGLFPIKNSSINKVIFNDPCTIILWTDGSKTVVKAVNEKFDPEKGLAMAISKKALGNKGNYYESFKKWLPKEKETEQQKTDTVFKPSCDMTYGTSLVEVQNNEHK